MFCKVEQQEATAVFGGFPKQESILCTKTLGFNCGFRGTRQNIRRRAFSLTKTGAVELSDTGVEKKYETLGDVLYWKDPI